MVRQCRLIVTAGEDGIVKIVSRKSLLVHLSQESTANLNRQKVDNLCTDPCPRFLLRGGGGGGGGSVHRLKVDDQNLEDKRRAKYCKALCCDSCGHHEFYQNSADRRNCHQNK